MLDIESEHEELDRSIFQVKFMNVRGGIEWDRKVGVRQYYTFEYEGLFKG